VTVVAVVTVEISEMSSEAHELSRRNDEGVTCMCDSTGGREFQGFFRFKKASIFRNEDRARQTFGSVPKGRLVRVTRCNPGGS
jgi:hypothetical protein